VAPIVWLFGGRLGLHLLPLLESLMVVCLTYGLARRIIDRQGALLAAGMAWFAPAAFVWFSTRQTMFYLPDVILGLSTMLLAVDVRERHTEGSPLRWAAIGLAAGLGWWTSPQILLYVVPIAGWLIVRLGPRAFSAGWPAVPGALVGASAWLWHQLTDPSAPLLALPAGGDGSYTDRLETFTSHGLPLALGVKQSMSLVWVASWASVAFAAFLLVILRAFLRPGGAPGVHLWMLGLYPFILALSPVASYVDTGRYLFFLGPILAIVLMHGARTLAVRVSYKLMYESDRQILAATTGADRNPAITARVLEAEDLAYVYSTIYPNWEELTGAAVEALSELQIEADLVEVSGYVILIPEGLVRPHELPTAALPT
jgi:hypothetical protein